MTFPRTVCKGVCRVLKLKVDISDEEFAKFKANCKARGRTVQGMIGLLITDQNMAWEKQATASYAENIAEVRYAQQKRASKETDDHDPVD